MSKYTDFVSYSMGTDLVQRIYGEGREYVAELVQKEIHKIERLMSFYDAQSELSRINAASGSEEVQVSKDTLKVVNTSMQYSELSKGLFDVTIGPLIKLWGIFTENEVVPAETEIEKVRQLVNYQDVVINEKTNSIRLNKKGQMIDLGGIAKGYAADMVIEIYKEQGIKSAFINIGGNVLTLGSKPDGSPWNIGLQDPAKPRGQYIGVLNVVDQAVVTSGDYVRFFDEEGVRYHHILNPFTGYPANSDLFSVTIMAKYSIEADGLSTPVYSLGLKEGMELVNRRKDTEAIFITKDRRIVLTEGAAEIFTFVGDSSDYEYRK